VIDGLALALALVVLAATLETAVARPPYVSEAAALSVGGVHLVIVGAIGLSGAGDALRDLGPTVCSHRSCSRRRRGCARALRPRSSVRAPGELGVVMLPVSNLTNLLAFHASRLSFVRFAASMVLPTIRKDPKATLALTTGPLASPPFGRGKGGLPPPANAKLLPRLAGLDTKRRRSRCGTRLPCFRARDGRLSGDAAVSDEDGDCIPRCLVGGVVAPPVCGCGASAHPGRVRSARSSGLFFAVCVHKHRDRSTVECELALRPEHSPQVRLPQGRARCVTRCGAWVTGFDCGGWCRVS
jgi:hypothetical protein